MSGNTLIVKRCFEENIEWDEIIDEYNCHNRLPNVLSASPIYILFKTPTNCSSFFNDGEVMEYITESVDSENLINYCIVMKLRTKYVHLEVVRTSAKRK
jgi:hypothetical protein